MAIANTTVLRLHRNGATIDCEVDSSVEVTRELKEVVCKDQPNGTIILGKISATANVSGLYELSPSGTGGIDLLNDLINGTEVTASWSSTEGGSTVSFSAYVTSWSGTSSGVGESGQFSATFSKSQGDVTVS